MREAVGPTDDGDLLRRLRGGDEDAFSELYRRWQGPMYRFALRMSGSPPVAEDVTQEVFMAIMAEGSRYDPSRGAVSSYLYGIARHQVLRRLDRERGLVPLPEHDDEATMPGASAWGELADPLAEAVRRERIDRVWQAVLALPPHYREAVVFCDLQGLRYTEVAEVLGCPVGTVRSRLHRGRELLGTKLQAVDPSRPALPTAAGGTP
ncbi:MAG TPA: RNA polymerase sigma factor [Vicinamibacteria bacterium]|jgi:RNA polymerase sigma-70 factor (ECF subfamily)|nr:RNA polymerase sigma factor [Vicinamibacteria bacterium]